MNVRDGEKEIYGFPLFGRERGPPELFSRVQEGGQFSGSKGPSFLKGSFKLRNAGRLHHAAV